MRAKKQERPTERGRCEHCRAPNVDAALLEPDETADGVARRWVCATLECQAFITWDDERWAGAARMAYARRRAGLPLTHVDHEAVRRHPYDGFWFVDFETVTEGLPR